MTRWRAHFSSAGALEATLAEYEHRLVAFLDVLGWKHFIEVSKDNPTLVNSLVEAVTIPSSVYWANRGHGSDMMAFENILTRTQFSDSIIISCHISKSDDYTPIAVHHLFSLVQGICCLLLSKGFPVRGGIADGLLYHKDNIVFGPALNSAIELEQTKAIFPRVVVQTPSEQRQLSEELITTVKSIQRAVYENQRLRVFDGIMQMDLPDAFLATDQDGLKFVDFLSDRSGLARMRLYRDQMKAVVERSLVEHLLNPQIHHKYRWLDWYFAQRGMRA